MSDEQTGPEETDPARNRALALLGLGLSVLAAAIGLGYFWLQDQPIIGVGLAVLVVAAGVWEYYQKLAEVRAAVRAEQDNG